MATSDPTPAQQPDGGAEAKRRHDWIKQPAVCRNCGRVAKVLNQFEYPDFAAAVYCPDTPIPPVSPREAVYRAVDALIDAERAFNVAERDGGLEWGPGKVDYSTARAHDFDDVFPFACKIQNCDVERGSGEALWNGGKCTETAIVDWPSGWAAKRAQDDLLKRIRELIAIAARKESADAR